MHRYVRQTLASTSWTINRVMLCYTAVEAFFNTDEVMCTHISLPQDTGTVTGHRTGDMLHMAHNAELDEA